MITRIQFFIGILGLLVCLNFVLANSLWLRAVESNWMSQASAEAWYFKSQALLAPVLLWGIRELFKERNTFFFIGFDLFLNFALLSLLAEFLGDHTKYYISQYVVGFLSLLVSMWQYKRLKNKQKKQ